MNRRTFVTGLGAALAAPISAKAQPAGKMWRIGYKIVAQGVYPAIVTDQPALEFGR